MSNSKTRKNDKPRKFDSELCDDKMTFQDCELAILRDAVDESEKIVGKKTANSEEVKRMIVILENFLIRKKLICYGGTAINNILPKFAQFYDRDIEIPDYDFFSPTALEDAKELADIYYKSGYVEVEAKSGMHHGTFKVYVNFIPMADITQLHPVIYKNLSRESLTVAGIKYAHPDYLRMAMFLELSRPEGDVSRWEKVLKRLTLLNKFRPMKTGLQCQTVKFQRKMKMSAKTAAQIQGLVRDSFIEQGVVFFGGYAAALYSEKMPEKLRRKFAGPNPDFDVLYDEPEKCAAIVKEKLEENGIHGVTLVAHSELGEIIPYHIEVAVNKIAVAFIYKPIACHSYNKIVLDQREINVATIDTMLSFYLAFLYADKPYYSRERILCMSKFLFELEQRNRLEQRGILKRFSLLCYGKQPTLETIRAEKTEMFHKLAAKKGSKEYENWFLKYNPGLTAKGLPKKTEKEIIESIHNLSDLPPIVSLKYSKGLGKEKGVKTEKLVTEQKNAATDHIQSISASSLPLSLPPPSSEGLPSEKPTKKVRFLGKKRRTRRKKRVGYYRNFLNPTDGNFLV